MSAIRIHSFADVDRSGKVRWTACELGMDVEEARVQIPDHLGSAFRELNPYAQIPVAEVDGEVLIESTATCIVLAERHPDVPLIPAGGPQRERFWRLVAVATTTLEQPVVSYFLGQRGVADTRWTELLSESLPSRLETFAREVPARGYLCGDFSLADIFAAYVLRIGVQAELLECAGELGAYLERLRARPAAIRSRIFDSLPPPSA